MNNKAFGNIFCNSQKSFTPLRDLPTRIIGLSTILQTQQWHLHLQKILGFFVNANTIVEFEEWSIASIIRVGRFRRGVENSFLDYRIYYQKLCYLMRQITKDLNRPSGQIFPIISLGLDSMFLPKYELWTHYKQFGQNNGSTLFPN